MSDRDMGVDQGFGRRNPHCMTCGDLRGGAFGHETSECRYRPGMTLPGFDPATREHFWGVSVFHAVDQCCIDAVREGRPIQLGDARQVSPIHCAYCHHAIDRVEGQPCAGPFLAEVLDLDRRHG